MNDEVNIQSDKEFNESEIECSDNWFEDEDKRMKQMTFTLVNNLYHGKKQHYFLMIIVYKMDLGTGRVVQRKIMKTMKRL